MFVCEIPPEKVRQIGKACGRKLKGERKSEERKHSKLFSSLSFFSVKFSNS